MLPDTVIRLHSLLVGPIATSLQGAAAADLGDRKQYFRQRRPSTATQFGDPETYLFVGTGGKQCPARSSPHGLAGQGGAGAPAGWRATWVVAWSGRAGRVPPGRIDRVASWRVVTARLATLTATD